MDSTELYKMQNGARFKSIEEFEVSENAKLGSGSFAQVFLAKHKATDKFYAIKTVF